MNTSIEIVYTYHQSEITDYRPPPHIHTSNKQCRESSDADVQKYWFVTNTRVREEMNLFLCVRQLTTLERIDSRSRVYH